MGQHRVATPRNNLPYNFSRQRWKLSLHNDYAKFSI